MPDLTVTLPATEAGSSLPVEQQVDLTSSDGKRIDVTLTSDQSWLTPNPATAQMASSGASVNLEADISGLAVGSHSATVSVAATNSTCATNSPYEIQADITITQPPPPSTGLTQPMIGVSGFIRLVYGFTAGGEAVTAAANLTYPIVNLGSGSLSGLSASTTSGNVGVSIVGGNLELDMSSYLPENISGTENATITINDAGASNDGVVLNFSVTGAQQGTSIANGDDWHALDTATSVVSVKTQQGTNAANETMRVLDATTFNNHGNAAGSGGVHPLGTYAVTAQSLNDQTAITGGSGSTINFASGALPNLSNGDTVIISNTGEYGNQQFDGTHVVSNVTASSFDVPTSGSAFSGVIDVVDATSWVSAAPATAGEDTDLTLTFTTSSLTAGVYRAYVTLAIQDTDYVLNPITHTVWLEVV